MKISFLGQVSFLFEADSKKFLIDPYFSNSVEEKEDSSIKRMVPIIYAPETLTDIDFVLVTHAHRDHCDPDTLIPLSVASPNCQFFGPAPVIGVLGKAGISSERLTLVVDEPLQFGNITITPVPSAHPVVNPDTRGGWKAIGYIFQVEDKTYYHPGDTAVSPEVIEAVSKYAPIDVGMIPVNEINYYRNQEGIIGNMSVREAFLFSEEIGVKLFIPTHWDMFDKNQVYREEIELLYRKIQPDFVLKVLSAGETL
jgi:L-ascorbate metabolism protein UlaG (beta-lactamase superfamily)